MQSTNMHEFYRVAIVMASITISTRAQAASTDDILAKSTEIQEVVDLMKTNFDSHADTVKDQLEDLHDRSETRKANREKTAGRRLEDAAQRQRAGARAARGVEMRIAGQVAQEIAPLVPSAPHHHQRPNNNHQSR